MVDQADTADDRRVVVDPTEEDAGAPEALVQALAQERNLLRAVMENTPVHMAYLDPDFNFVMVNKAYAVGSGFSREDLIGTNHFALFPDDENRAIFERVRDTGEPVTVEAKPFAFPNQPELGVTYWDWTLAPVMDAAGENVEGLILSLLDVTQRYVDQAKIVDLARFPSENPFPVLRIARDGRLLYANESSRPLLKYWEVEVGDPIPQRWRDHVAEVIRTREPYAAEIRCDGAFYALTIAPAYIGEHDEDSYTNLYGIDITDLRRTQRSLRQYAGRLNVLHQIDQAILAAESVDAIMDVTLAKLPKMVRFSHASVMLCDFEAQTCSLLAATSPRHDATLQKGWSAPLEVIGTEQLDKLRRGEAIVMTGISMDEASVSALTELLLKDGTYALVHQPMLVQGALIGVFTLGLPEPEMLSSSLIELARELGIQLAIAIQQARLHQQVQDHAKTLEQRVAWRTSALRISEARFRAIFEDAPMGIALLDQDGHIIQCNAALAEILGLDSASIIDSSLFSHMPEDDANFVRQRYQDLLGGADAPHRHEFRVVSAQDRMTWCTITISLVRDVGRQPRLAIGIIEDITQQRDAQVALVRTEKLALTGQMAASLAHEINNPLQTVIGCLGLADESLAMGDRDVTTYLSMASRELKRAASIVGRLRDLNRRSTEADREPTSLDAVVKQVLRITHKQCVDRGITTRIRRFRDDGSPEVMPFPGPDSPVVIEQDFPADALTSDEGASDEGASDEGASAEGDSLEALANVGASEEGAPSEGYDGEDYVVNIVPGRIQQVFLNLVLNAIDAMPEGGDLLVTLRREPSSTGARARDEVHVAFQDTGVGMEQDVQERLFNPFYTTKSEGLGLGLFISQSIIVDHDGRIEVSSVPGEGTTFHIWLPT
jgi:PAS domain S-box-containing protein